MEKTFKKTITKLGLWQYKQNLTLDQLAYVLGLSRIYICKILNGHEPGPESRECIRKLLDGETDYKSLLMSYTKKTKKNNNKECC